jgi:hypothetical protein
VSGGGVEEFLKDKRTELERENESFRRSEAGMAMPTDANADTSSDGDYEERLALLRAIQEDFADVPISSYDLIAEKQEEIERELEREGRAESGRS